MSSVRLIIPRYSTMNKFIKTWGVPVLKENITNDSVEITGSSLKNKNSNFYLSNETFTFNNQHYGTNIILRTTLQLFGKPLLTQLDSSIHGSNEWYIEQIPEKFITEHLRNNILFSHNSGFLYKNDHEKNKIQICPDFFISDSPCYYHYNFEETDEFNFMKNIENSFEYTPDSYSK